MTRLAFAVACVAGLAAGCGPHVGQGTQDAPGTTGDGAVGDGNVANDDGNNTPHDARIDGTPDATPCTGRVIYLDFDGVTLTQGSPTDASLNTASWLPSASAVIPEFRGSDANRAAEEQAVVTGLENSLGQFPVAVVRTRPATGQYVLVAVGGSEATNVGFGTAYAGYAGFDCGDEIASDVVWVTDSIATQDTVDLIVGGVGLSIGLLGTSGTGAADTSNDCMCQWGGVACNPVSTACTLSTSIMSPDTTHCPGTQPQDEVAVFRTAFCN